MSRRPIAFNNSTKTNNSIKKNKIEIGLASDSYSSNPGGLTWFNGADSTNQYVIYSDTFSLGMTTLANAKPVCWASGDITDANVLRMINGLPTRNNQAPFTTIDSALAWVAASSVFNMVSGTLDNIVTNGLVLNVDASQKGSYPGSGTTWYDSSGNDYNGTLTNGATFNSADGGSIVFDGANDYTASSYNGITGTNPRTFSIWFKPNNSQNRNLLGYGTENNKNMWDILLYNGNVGVHLYNSGAEAGTPYTVGVWQNITFTYTHPTIKSYMNGVYKNLYTDPTINTGTNYPLNIAKGTYAPYYYFNGNISTTQIYNRGLSDAEVLQNYNAQKTKFGL
jgi:hypothetical protein